MDKYELTIKIEKLDKLVKSKDYVNAAKVADQIEWKKMKQWSVMSNAIDAFVGAGKYDKARNVCVYAYNRKLGGRRLLATLMDMYVRLGEYDDAEEIYQEYVELAPRDVTGFILLYKLKRAQGAPVEELINILQEYKEKELDEEYEFELALLYSEAGMTDKCVKECDELVLWFSDGIYVEKALKLKQLYAPLTPKQAEKLARLESMQEAAAAAEEPQYNYEPEAKPQKYDYEPETRVYQKPQHDYRSETATREYEQLKYEEPRYNQPQGVETWQQEYGQPQNEQQRYEQPKYNQSQGVETWQQEYGQPRYEQPKYNQPQGVETWQQEYGQPKYNQPQGEEMWQNEAGQPQYEQPQPEQYPQEAQQYDDMPYPDQQPAEEYAELNGNDESESASDDDGSLQVAYIDDIGNTTEWSPIDIEKAMEQPAPKAAPNKASQPAAEPQHHHHHRASAVNAGADMQQLDTDYDIDIKVPDYSVYDTRNVQQELKANVKEIMEAYRNREKTEAMREAAQLEDMDGDSDPTKEIIINKHQWRKASRNSAKHQDMQPAAAPKPRTEAPEPTVSPDAAIRQAAQKMTLEQMSELVAQLQAEQERRRREAAKQNPQTTGQMDISQWLTDIDDDEPAVEAKKEAPVAEPAAEVKTEAPTQPVAQPETKVKTEPPVAAPEPDDYSAAEREAIAKTVREIAASYDIHSQDNDSDDDTGFEEIPDVEESGYDEEDEDSTEVPSPEDSYDELPDLEKAVNAGIEKIIDDSMKAAVGAADSERYYLKDEEKVFLDKYLYMTGMERRLCRYIGSWRAGQNGSEEIGNVAIMGSRNTDKTAFAVNLFKALHVYDADREQKLARISADKINEKGYEAYADKLVGQTLVIENAGRLRREAVASMLELGVSTLFMIIDEEFEINKLFADNPDFSDAFTGRFLLKQYTVNELVDIAKDFAEEQGWRVEDKALLKLYLILSQIPNDDNGNIVDIVKELMQHAAKHARRRFGNKLFGRFRSVLVIKESDLMSEEEYDDDEDEDDEEAQDTKGGNEYEDSYDDDDEE